MSVTIYKGGDRVEPEDLENAGFVNVEIQCQNCGAGDDFTTDKIYTQDAGEDTVCSYSVQLSICDTCGKTGTFDVIKQTITK